MPSEAAGSSRFRVAVYSQHWVRADILSVFGRHLRSFCIGALFDPFFPWEGSFEDIALYLLRARVHELMLMSFECAWSAAGLPLHWYCLDCCNFLPMERVWVAPLIEESGPRITYGCFYTTVSCLVWRDGRPVGFDAPETSSGSEAWGVFGDCWCLVARDGPSRQLYRWRKTCPAERRPGRLRPHFPAAAGVKGAVDPSEPTPVDVLWSRLRCA